MEMMNVSKFTSLKSEDVAVIRKSDSVITALAEVETWEECPKTFSNDPYRILIFEDDYSNNSWILDNSTIINYGLIDAITKKSSEQCGGILFAHEFKRNTFNTFTELHNLYSNLNPTLLSIQKSESKELFNLDDGVYMVYTKAQY